MPVKEHPMEDGMREELVSFFEHDIGPPPAGARERVVDGFSRSVRGPRTGRLQWMAGPTAVLLTILTITALLVARYDRVPRPAGPAETPGPRIGAAVAYDARHGVLVLF